MLLPDLIARGRRPLAALVAALLLPLWSASAIAEPGREAEPQSDKAREADEWQPLFNGRNLDGWQVTDFGGQGEVFVENGEVVISQGADLSGIHTDKKLPVLNYEIQYEAQRAAGGDFFAGLTFPVGTSSCSLINGGWGGGVCGLSSLDGMDASENETTTYQQFDKGVWYRFRVLVTDQRIQAWINEMQIVDVETKDRRISVRFEVEKSRPLGFSTWRTTGRIRNARIRALPENAPSEKP